MAGSRPGHGRTQQFSLQRISPATTTLRRISEMVRAAEFAEAFFSVRFSQHAHFSLPRPPMNRPLRSADMLELAATSNCCVVCASSNDNQSSSSPSLSLTSSPSATACSFRCFARTFFFSRSLLSFFATLNTPPVPAPQAAQDGFFRYRCSAQASQK